MGWVRDRSQQLNSGFPLGSQEPNYLSRGLCLPGSALEGAGLRAGTWTWIIGSWSCILTAGPSGNVNSVLKYRTITWKKNSPKTSEQSLMSEKKIWFLFFLNCCCWKKKVVMICSYTRWQSWLSFGLSQTSFQKSLPILHIRPWTTWSTLGQYNLYDVFSC